MNRFILKVVIICYELCHEDNKKLKMFCLQQICCSCYQKNRFVAIGMLSIIT